MFNHLHLDLDTQISYFLSKLDILSFQSTHIFPLVECTVCIFTNVDDSDQLLTCLDWKYNGQGGAHQVLAKPITPDVGLWKLQSWSGGS